MVRAFLLKQHYYTGPKIFSRGSVDNSYKNKDNGFASSFTIWQLKKLSLIPFRDLCIPEEK